MVCLAIVTALLVLSAALLIASGKPAPSAPSAPSAPVVPTLVQVSGRVRLVGNMPFPHLVVSDGEFDWYVEGDDELLLRRYEQQTVRIEGRPEYLDLTLANGQKIGTRRFLRNVRLLTPSLQK
jgi:hypothetical protein